MTLPWCVLLCNPVVPTIEELMRRFQTLPAHLIIRQMAAKSIGGVGLGLLLASWNPSVDWRVWGWSALGLAWVMGYSGASGIFRDQASRS